MRALLALVLLSSLATAQDPPFHTTRRDFISEPNTYGDCWGTGNLAFVGRWGFQDPDGNRVDIIDVSNPDNIVKIATYSVPAPSDGSSAQDMQASNGIMYVGLELSGANGVDIVDIRTPNSPVHKTFVNSNPGQFEIIHDVFFDNGWLYMCNSRDTSLAILDLRTYNVNSPPAQISNWTYFLDNLGDPGAFVHDITVRNGELYVSGWGSTEVWNVANLGTAAPTLLGEVRGFNSHSNWPSDDEAFLVVCEERQGGAARLYQMTRVGNVVTLIPRDSWVNPQTGIGESLCTHDPRIVGDRVYVSNYSGGLLVLQVDRTSWTWEKVASFDTTVLPANDFFGVWGAYPYLGEERVLVSDLELGFHVIDCSALEINHIAPRPTMIPPSSTTAVSVRIDTIGSRVLSNVQLRTSIEGAPFQSTVMTAQGGNVYAGNLPALSFGQKVDWYVAATATNAEVYTSPANAPTKVFSAFAAHSTTTLFSDDFQTNMGWTVTNNGVSTGAWTRVDPVESGGQPDKGDPASVDNHCYITGNGAVGGGVGDADLDGGPTILTSPNINFGNGDGLISYKRWFFTNTDNDSLVVEISNNGGTSWTNVETVTRKGGGWLSNTFRVSDKVAPSNQIRVRFSVSDNPNDSTTEAGVDTFQAVRFGASASLASRNGTGVNVVCYSPLSLPVLGTNWNTLISHNHHPGAQSTWILSRLAPSTGPMTQYGQVLINFQSPFLFTHVVPSAGTFDNHSVAVPNDPNLTGLTCYTQAMIFGGGIELCNALDATLGF